MNRIKHYKRGDELWGDKLEKILRQKLPTASDEIIDEIRGAIINLLWLE